MFDAVSHRQDPDALRRSAESLTATVLLMGSSGGILLWLSLTAVPQIAAIADLSEPTFPEEFEPVVDLGGLPPPPAARGVEIAREAEPEVAPEVPKPLSEVTPVVQQAAVVGKPDGRNDGARDGDPDSLTPGPSDATGKGKGRGKGDGRGDGEGSYRVFHHLDLTPRRRIEPSYPEAAKPLALGDQACRAQVWIDPKGVPQSVEVSGCESVFHDETREALMKWRWYPPKVAGEATAVAGVTTIVFKYRLER